MLEFAAKLQPEFIAQLRETGLCNTISTYQIYCFTHEYCDTFQREKIPIDKRLVRLPMEQVRPDFIRNRTVYCTLIYIREHAGCHLETVIEIHVTYFSIGTTLHVDSTLSQVMIVLSWQ